MAISVQPGDVWINFITLTSDAGTIALDQMLSTMKIYESIFNPNCILELEVLDINDQIGQMPIVGGETITLEFGAPNGTIADYTFIVDTLTDGDDTSKTKMYTLHGVGKETLMSKTNFVQKSYNTDIGSMVQDIHGNYLKSQKSLSIEATNGTQNILIPNYDPFKAIDTLRRRAVSQQNQSSTYVYWETYAGMGFKTIEGMFNQGAVKTFTKLDTTGSSIYEIADNNIIDFEPVQIASAVDRIQNGGLNQRVATYNVRTRSYQFKDVQQPQGTYGMTGRYNSSSFMSTYGANYGKFSMIPVDTASRPFTNIDTMTPAQMAYVSNLTQNRVNIRVYGDCIVKAGDLITLSIPSSVNTTGYSTDDPMLSGNYVASQLCRNIDISQERPRYTETIECISGSLATGVQS